MRKSLAVIFFCMIFGVARLALYWIVELWLHVRHVSDRASDVTHSMMSAILFCITGWFVWQFSARKAAQKFIDDQVRNGLQIVRNLEVLETDPKKQAALQAVDVKFAEAGGNGRLAVRRKLIWRGARREE